MVNWAADFVNPLKAKLSPANKSLSVAVTANLIATQYCKAVRNAEVILTKCKLVSPILPALMSQALVLAFTEGMTGSPLALSVEKNISPALVTMWTGAVFGSNYTGMPPGHVSFIPPCIVPIGTPGLPGFFAKFVPKYYSASSDEMINAFKLSFEAHLATLAGLHTAIVLPSPAPPYPLPWIGVK